MATSAALSRSNLYTQVFWNVFNLINTRTNVIDPTDASGSRKLVYAREPSVNARNFEGYPLIIVHPASVNRGELHMGDDKVAEISSEVVIEVRSSTNWFRKSTADDPHGKALSFLDDMSDDVMETLNSVSNRNTLRGNNIGFVEMEGRSVETIDVSGETIFVREFVINTRTPLLTVSS